MSIEAMMDKNTVFVKPEDWRRLLSPFSEMPVWALLRFQKKIPETYFWDNDENNPRKMSEVTATGFRRLSENLIYVSFFLEWILDGHFVTIYYTMALVKPPS